VDADGPTVTAWTDDTDPFGTLSRVPDGVVLPELSLALYDSRDNIIVTLPWVRSMVAATALSEWFEERIAERKKVLNPDTKAGRPRDVTVEAILVAWFMGKFARNSFLHTETARFLLSTLTDQQRADLGVPLVHRDPTAAPMLADRRVRMDKDAVGKRISRLSKQMDDLINPSRYNQARSRIATVDKETLLRLLVQLLPTRFKEAAADDAKTDAETKAKAASADDAKVEAAGKAAARAAAKTDGVVPRICQGSVSVRRETLVKHRQPLIYGSGTHKVIHRAARNSQEGFHGFAKDDAQEAMGAPGLRRKRGLPAQSLFAAIGFAVASIRKIVSFLSHMQQDEHGDFYVLRKPRPGSEHLALGEGGGYQDNDDDNWPADWLEDIPDAA